jgi:hypothetical protein
MRRVIFLSSFLPIKVGGILLSIVFALGSEMHHLNNNKKKKNNNNHIATAATTLFILATILVVAGLATIIIGINQSADASSITNPQAGKTMKMLAEAPVVVSGDNIYIAWWTNNTENNNEEVMFRASNDGGQTFSDKINLSNTTDADSWRVEIAAEGENVAVSWWETTLSANQTATATTNQTEGAAASEAPQDVPVMRVSNDGGQTFGPLLRLATNGTIGSTEEGGGEAE